MSEQDRRKDPYYPELTLHYNESGPSVFGELDPVTLRFLGRLHGKLVLSVGAGDGRDTLPLFSQGNRVIASDVDLAALNSLRSRTPQEWQPLLHTVATAVDTTKEVRADNRDRFLAIKNDQFDAIVCTAFLYLYPPDILQRVFSDLHRVLKPGGELIFDFMTERVRRKPNGEVIKGEQEVNYSFDEGMQAIQNLTATTNGFTDLETDIFLIDQDLTASAGYRMTGKKIIASTRKA